jgi:hypothetical protein
MRALAGIYWLLVTRARDTVDELAVNWIVKRRSLPRAYTEALLIDLGRRMGAKVEFSDPPGNA